MAEHGITKEEMAVVLDEVLNRRRDIDNDTHKHDHEFIKMMREREERHARLWMKFKTSVVGSIAMAVVGALLWLGNLVMATWHNGQAGP